MRLRLRLALLLVAIAPVARADEPTDIAQARAEYVLGTEHVKAARWAEALAAFERSSKLHQHATTTFDIAACERVLGRYTRANATLHRALDENAARPGELAESFLADAKAMIAETEGVLVHAEVTISPRDVAIAIDGRSLHAETGASGGLVLIAGIDPPGMGAAPPADSFELVLDPGAHVITLSRPGYQTVLLHRTFAPGAHEKLPLSLATLPATLHIDSDVAKAVVTIDGYDVGLTPVWLSRPAGTYRIVVRRRDYEPYQAGVVLRAGEDAQLRASLVAEKRPVTATWWFWSTLLATAAGIAVLTYELARPAPAPPPYDGGSLGWVATPSSFRF